MQITSPIASYDLYRYEERQLLRDLELRRRQQERRGIPRRQPHRVRRAVQAATARLVRRSAAALARLGGGARRGAPCADCP